MMTIEKRRQKAEPGQIREWVNRREDYTPEPDIDVFIVLKTEGVNIYPDFTRDVIPAVEVMYPDGFVATHPKRELEWDSRIIK
jgi:hypothetical protein